MRILIFSLAASLCTMAAGQAAADRGELIGQLNKSGEETGQRSSASLSQIGKRATESGGLVDQIDPATVSDRRDIDESAVSDVLPARTDTGECILNDNQKAVLEYLRSEGRVFDDNCAMLAWLSNERDDPSDRDLFNVIFGPEAQRQHAAELERLEKEKAEAEAKARLLEAMAAAQGGGY